MDKLLSLLGIARRAGKLELGYDAAVIAVREGRAKLLLAASDMSEKTCKNLKFEADKKTVAFLKISQTQEELWKACGKRAGVAAVCDEGFARSARQTAEKEETSL